MKIFVTGATGFIGQHLVRRLVQDGHELRCLVRNPARAKDLQSSTVQLVVGGVNDPQSYHNAMQGCDWLFHLANIYSMWEVDPGQYWQVNVEGTRCVLQEALSAGVKKVVYVSTVAVFGKPDQSPFVEESQPGPVLFSEYARTKAAGNRVAWDFYRHQGLPLVVLYPGIVLGPGDDKASGQYIQDILFRRVPTTIFHRSISTYVGVGDVVEAMIRAAGDPGSIGQGYLVGGHPLNGKEFAQKISRISGVRLPFLHFPDWMVFAAAYFLAGLARLTRRPPIWGLSPDAARTLKHGFIFDGSKAKRELVIDYTPIDQVIQEAIASYQNGQKSALFEPLFRILHKEMEHPGGSHTRDSGKQECGGITAGIRQPSAD